MRFVSRQTFRRLRELLEETAPAPAEMALRLQSVERDIILPVKAAFVVILAYHLYFSHWFDDLAIPRSVVQQLTERFFLIYLAVNLAVAGLLLLARRSSLQLVQRVIFMGSFVDGLFVAALTVVTGGFDSILYWLFLALIVRNAVSCPLAVPQLLLNFSASVCYLLAGIVDVNVTNQMLDFEDLPQTALVNPTEPFLLRLILLWLFTLCCYGVQVLFEKQHQAAEEAREFTARQQQLRSAGRLAAQIAHQIKNPLGIINNAAFSLQRALQQGKSASQEQIRIIREEVERSDRILTELMGYAQLAEGKVEKLKLEEELDRAIGEVFPAAAAYETRVERDYAPHLPGLLMQRGHLHEILVNLLLNAREATEGRGVIQVQTGLADGDAVRLRIADNGPGIPPDRLERIFQPYFSTKEKGTGLGLAIARQNAEIYGGTVRVESELGKGAVFVVELPTRTFMKLQP